MTSASAILTHREARLRQREGQLVAAQRHALHQLPLLDAAPVSGDREGQVRRDGRHPERVQVEGRLRASHARSVSAFGQQPSAAGVRVHVNHCA